MVRPVLGTRSPQRRPLSPAQALDAADGVMDGRFFGHPIVQPSPIRRSAPFAWLQHMPNFAIVLGRKMM